MNYCVYTHSVRGKVFYVGCGLKNRPMSTNGRNYLWHQTVKENPDYEIKVVGWFFHRKDAIFHEGNLIETLKPAANKEVKGVRSRCDTSRENVTFLLKLSEADHADINRKAKAAGLPMYKYILYMSIDGRLPKSKPSKSTT